MEIVLSVNRSWIDDAYFGLYRPIHPGEKSWGESWGNVRIPTSSTMQPNKCIIVTEA